MAQQLPQSKQKHYKDGGAHNKHLGSSELIEDHLDRHFSLAPFAFSRSLSDSHWEIAYLCGRSI